MRNFNEIHNAVVLLDQCRVEKAHQAMSVVAASPSAVAFSYAAPYSFPFALSTAALCFCEHSVGEMTEYVAWTTFLL